MAYEVEERRLRCDECKTLSPLYRSNVSEKPLKEFRAYVARWDNWARIEGQDFCGTCAPAKRPPKLTPRERKTDRIAIVQQVLEATTPAQDSASLAREIVEALWPDRRQRPVERDAEILAKSRAGTKIRKLAEEYGVSTSRIRAILARASRREKQPV